MRRLLLAALLLTSSAVPVHAGDAPARPMPYRAPGTTPLAPTDGAGWLDAQFEAASAGSPFAEKLQRKMDLSRARADATEYDFTDAGTIPDVDRDGVADLLSYRSRWTNTNLGPVGDLDLAVYSGRTGAKYWARRYQGGALAAVFDVKVGADGRPGLLVAMFTRPSEDERRLRVVGVDGRRGSSVYDKVFTNTDGLGDIQWGGLFDAFGGGGTDLLVGRVRPIADVVHGMQLYEVRPFAVDGRQGTIRAVRDSEIVLASGFAYVAVGDVDGDSRDDFLAVRKMLAGTGDVTAYGVSENEVHWTTDGVVVGWFVRSGGNGDIVGAKHEDVLLDSWSTEPGLLEIDGVTDGLPLLDGPPEGIHGLLFEGTTGELMWDRLDGFLGHYAVWNDVNKDRKADVLAVGMIRDGDRDGVRVLVVSGTNAVLRRREITVAAPIGRNVTGVATGAAGDLDGDRLEDLSYYVLSASALQTVQTRGIVLLGPNRVVVTQDYPFYGTLDGGSAERLVHKPGTTTTFTVADGWRGPAYWTVTAKAAKSSFGLWPLPGARGRCDGALLYGGTADSLWVYALDGATGKVRWSRTLAGRRPSVTLTAKGRAARCR